MNDVYESKDRQIVPLLFIQKDIDYRGSLIRNEDVIFLFSPLNKCLELANLLLTRKAPLVQPKDLLDAIETYKNIIFEYKNGRKGQRV